MKKLLLCLVALFAAIGAQASTQTITKGEGTSGTSTVKFSATGKPDITAKAVYTLTLNADNKLKVELTFADLKNSDVEGLVNEFCYMFIDGIGETSLSYADGKYTGTTSGTATPGNFYSNCYFKLACANTGTNYGENGQLIFPFEFTAPSDAAESEISGVVSDITATTATLTLTCKPAEGKTVDKIVVSGLGVGKDITFTSTDNLTANLKDLTPGTKYDLTFTLTYTDNSTAVATKGFKTAEGTKPSITYTAFNGVTNITSNSADIKFTVTLANPDNYPIEYWRLASARAAGDTKLDGVEYEKWPYNTDLIWGEYRSTENADGSYVITIPLKNLPAGTNISNWMKSEIKLSGSDAYESGGFDNQVFTTLAAGSITAEITNVTANSAVLTLTSVPEGTTSVVVSGLGEGKDVNVDLDSKTAELTGLTAETTYNLTLTASFEGGKTTQSTVSFTTLTAPKEVSMEFIDVNISDLSALFKLKVQLIDNAESKESIHMYLRKANETPKATADDPYAKYGEEKGTPAVEMRDGIENPIYFNYTELEKNTKYVATAVVKKDGYTGIATKEFETLGEANGTTSYIENGYFKDGKVTTSDDGQELKITYLATARYTFTYDKNTETLYLTFNTRIHNNPDLPDLQAKYMLNVGDKTYYGAPLSKKGGFKDHFSFVINYRCPDIATHIANGDKMTFTYMTDYASGGTSHFGGVQYDGTTSSVDFGEPADIQWINYTYDQQKPENENKNRYDLYKKAPKTQLMASVVDKDGHYLPRRLVKFEMAAEHADKADVTYDLFDEQPRWFVTAKEQPANTHVDFEVVAYHELETEATGAPRRVLNADKNRLEAKRGFHYVESETPTGIDDIEADDANAPVRYFDLNGREISEPQKGMFVIRLQGSKATKMIAE